MKTNERKPRTRRTFNSNFLNVKPTNFLTPAATCASSAPARLAALRAALASASRAAVAGGTHRASTYEARMSDHAPVVVDYAV